MRVVASARSRTRALARHIAVTPSSCRSAAASGSSDWRDPHSISSQLDAQTSAAIVSRLESRGKDPIFRSLFDTYFPFLISNCSNVLEIGAGTGVVSRALVASGYRGRLLGVDQSQVFVDAAAKFAAEEGISAGALRFAVADARTLQADVGSNDFDGVVMHTLISHVDDPLHVLKAAREVAKPGAALVVVDGDYPGLSYHSPTRLHLSESVSRALVKATFAAPSVIRDLPALLSQSGWAVESASGRCVSEIGGEFSYWKTFAEAYMPRVVGSGLMPEADVRDWWAEQLRLAERRQFFAACTYYTVVARAV